MKRAKYFNMISKAFQVNPVVALLGPRQCGKTTLARHYVESMPEPFSFATHFFDLEDPLHLSRLQNSRLTLGELKGLVVLDEIQRTPDLFRVLRVMVDEPDCGLRFLILGSASRDLIRQSSESLAGRISYIDLPPFSLDEVGVDRSKTLWVRGGFPPSFLARDEEASREWREGYIRTFLERDIPQLGIQIPAPTLRRFWMMLAHYHGQIFNASELARSLDTTDTTMKRYLDILNGTLMIRALPPWFENISKRQVKRPKIYFRDSGIFHHLLGIHDETALKLHPKLGASWEGFALEQIIHLYGATEGEVYFWGVHNQMELDLLLIKQGRRLGFEVKFTETPRVQTAHEASVSTLKLDKLFFVCPGDIEAPVSEKIRLIGLNRLLTKKNRRDLGVKEPK